jgi:mRNA interferase RelE/StbE
MQVLFTKQFEKEIRVIRDKKLAQHIEDAILNVKSAESVSQIHNLKKLSGYKNSYRIRIGEYRIGVYVTGDSVVFSRFLHRKEIYRYFP